MIISKKLPSREELNKLFCYCEDTGYLYWRILARGRSVKKPVGSLSNKYPQVRINKELFLLNRVIYVIAIDELSEEEIVDHVDGDTHNNKPYNLRATDQQTNTKNSKKRKSNKSGVNGVIWNKRSKKWQAFIHIDGKQKHLGLFKDKKLAIISRIEAEKSHKYSERHGL